MREEAARGSRGRKEAPGSSYLDWTIVSMVASCWALGYLIGYAAKDQLFTAQPPPPLAAAASSGPPAIAAAAKAAGKEVKWPGNTVHTLLTSSGDGYQNFQTRILYASYKLIQKQPGGEAHTGFTRILHRTVPDILMDEVPTFHVWNPVKPQCDGWCDYPVANRPNAIVQFFDAVRKNSSMISGAWVLMIECDYVFMRPFKTPGDAYDPNVPGEQYFYDYIMPQHPNAVPHIQKLAGRQNISDVPPAGPAPVVLRLHEWQAVVRDYEDASKRMEADEKMKKALEWVREMYAWDVAIAAHTEIKVRTLKPPNSTLIVQPPFDEGLFSACMAHYTWGALYFDTKQNKKQIYRWEKRDFTDMKHVVKVPSIPMPPEWREGILLEFDAPLTKPRHDFVVVYLTQMNKAIDTLTDLSDKLKGLDPKIEAFRKWRTEQLEGRLIRENVELVPWSPKRTGKSDGVVAGGTLAEPPPPPKARRMML